jgi:H+/Cl- antiporter ClcA
MMLLCGIAAGFGSVFGTPLTGAIFAMEVLVIGRIQYEAALPVLIASTVGDATCTAWGATHAVYAVPVASGFSVGGLLLLKVAAAGVGFGLAAWLFCKFCQLLHRGYARLIPFAPLRPALAGFVVVTLTLLLGTRDYLGLGADAPPGGHVSIAASFSEAGSDPFSWLWKSVFTAATVSGGFKGGEVTPLFFIGSTLGNSLAHLLDAPVALFAALGFVAVFAGAANTPLACTVLGVELFGVHYAPHFAAACFLAYVCSGKSGIYRSQGHHTQDQ